MIKLGGQHGGLVILSRCGNSALRCPKNVSIHAWSVGVPGRPKCTAIGCITLTVPTTKIKSRIDHRLPSATTLTVHTPVVVIHNDGQHALARSASRCSRRRGSMRCSQLSCRIHFRSVSALIPNRAETAVIAARSES